MSATVPLHLYYFTEDWKRRCSLCPRSPAVEATNKHYETRPTHVISRASLAPSSRGKFAVACKKHETTPFYDSITPPHSGCFVFILSFYNSRCLPILCKDLVTSGKTDLPPFFEFCTYWECSR